MLLKVMGEYQEAEPLLRRALGIRMSTLGPSHPDTLTSINNLALVLDSLEMYTDAENNHRRALKGREATLGKNHPDTLNSLNNLAVLLQKMGRHEEAEPLLRRALATLGSRHPEGRRTTLENLRALLHRTGRGAEAEQLDTDEVGTEHSTFTGTNNGTPVKQVALPEPRTDAVVIPDPRVDKQGKEVGVIAFCYPGREEACDSLCGAGYLGNWFDLGKDGMRIEAPNRPGKVVAFRNSEAAFQALRFWPMADEFAELSASVARKKQAKLADGADANFAGIGDSWCAMLAVLRAKFEAGTDWARALLKTGDTFLLQHGSEEGREMKWSNGGDGEGTNWLGLQLMLVRDSLCGTSLWTRHIKRLIDTETGAPVDEDAGRQWQETVQKATAAVSQAISFQLEAAGSDVPVCLRTGCTKPTWNGKALEYCSDACRLVAEGKAPAATVAICLRPGCGKPTWNGEPNDYCSHSCRNAAGSVAPASGATCVRPGCGKPTWNGQPGNYCGATACLAPTA